MELEINLPDEGSFYNKAGQLIEWKLDPEDKTKCTIRVDGKRIDWVKYAIEEAERLAKLEEMFKLTPPDEEVKE